MHKCHKCLATFLAALGGRRLLDLNINISWKRPISGGPHFPEAGHSPACSLSAIVQRLKQHYGQVRSGRFALNPYHMWFICE